MRTQLYVRLVGLTAAAAGLVGAVGCDDTTAGTAGDPKGPVKLVRVMVQDGASAGTARKFAVDLKEIDPKVSCDEDVNLCVPQYAIQGTQPGLACLDTGYCLDPLIPPAAGVPVEGAPNFVAVRVVFNKLLTDDSVTDGDMLKADAIQLLAADGTEVPTTKFWDHAGSPDFTSDVIKSPFGPALVAKPKDALATNSDYTIRIHPSTFKDREGNSPTDSDGVTPLADPTDFTFHTEPLTAPRASTSYPNLKDPTKAKIGPTAVVHLDLWPNVVLSPTGDSTAVNLTVLEAPFGLTSHDLLAYGPTKKVVDPNDPTKMCLIGPSAATSFSILPALNFWPEGHYKLTVAYADAAGTTFSQAIEFDVDHTLPAGAFDVSKFPVPTCAP